MEVASEAVDEPVDEGLIVATVLRLVRLHVGGLEFRDDSSLLELYGGV